MDLSNIKPDIRYLKDMENVVYDKDWLKTANPNLELYYIYRGVREKNGLRYDVTIIPPRMLGQEFVKTKGHQHPVEEIYKVLEGKAIFLIQKSKGKNVEDFYIVKAKKGNTITILPNYDHLAINLSNQELKLGNWVSKDCQNKYDLFEKMKGASYFYVKTPSTPLGASWIKNKNYKKIPELRFEEPN